MDMPESVTKWPITKVVTRQTDEDFNAEQYVVGKCTSAWQLVDSRIMRKALHTCIANQAYDETISALLERRPKGLETDSMKLLWRRKQLAVLFKASWKLSRISPKWPCSVSNIPNYWKKSEKENILS